VLLIPGSARSGISKAPPTRTRAHERRQVTDAMQHPQGFPSCDRTLRSTRPLTFVGRLSRSLPNGVVAQIAISVLAVAAILPPRLLRSQTSAGESLQLARAAAQTYHSHWKDNSDDNGADVDKPIGGSGARHSNGFKSGTSSYNPQQIKRFWSHYHGARPGPKEKPLEIQPRQK